MGEAEAGIRHGHMITGGGSASAWRKLGGPPCLAGRGGPSDPPTGLTCQVDGSRPSALSPPPPPAAIGENLPTVFEEFIEYTSH